MSTTSSSSGTRAGAARSDERAPEVAARASALLHFGDATCVGAAGPASLIAGSGLGASSLTPALPSARASTPKPSPRKLRWRRDRQAARRQAHAHAGGVGADGLAGRQAEVAQGADRRRARPIPRWPRRKVGVDGRRRRQRQDALRAQRRRRCSTPRRTSSCSPPRRRWRMLGPEYRWKTVVYADAPISGGELKGRLYLKGHGDPTLVVEDLWRWSSRSVRRRAAQGVGRPGRRRHLLRRRARRARLRAEAGGPAVPRAQRRALAQLQRGRRARAARRRRRRARARGDRSADALLHRHQRGAHRRRRAAPCSPSSRSETPDHTEITVARAHPHGRPGQLQLRRVAHPDLYTANAFRELLRAARDQGHRQRRARRDAADGARARRRTTRSRSAWRCATSTSAPTTSWPSRS